MYVTRFWHAGYSLIETLIAVLIFSIGLLGTLKMQLAAQQIIVQAQQYMLAGNLVHNMIERIRLTPFWNSNHQSNTDLIGIGTNALTAPACSTITGSMVNCNPSQLIAFNLYQWQQLMLNIAVMLPKQKRAVNILTEPLGCILTDKQGLIQVIISWHGKRQTSSPKAAITAQLANVAQPTILLAKLQNYASSCGLDSNQRHAVAMLAYIAS